MTTKLKPEQLAAYKFVESMVSREDGNNMGAPLWHGWALREAFEAGVAWARKGRNTTPVSSRKAKSKVRSVEGEAQ